MLDEAWVNTTSDKLPAVATILSYMTLVEGIQDIHHETVGREAPYARANALSHLLARNLSQRIPDNRVSEFILSN